MKLRPIFVAWPRHFHHVPIYINQQEKTLRESKYTNLHALIAIALFTVLFLLM